jgi:hypothetical protein
MGRGLSAGTFPEKVTVPVTVEAATKTRGQANTTPRISPADSHNVFFVTRMLSSLVVAEPIDDVTVDDGFRQTAAP